MPKNLSVPLPSEVQNVITLYGSRAQSPGKFLGALAVLKSDHRKRFFDWHRKQIAKATKVSKKDREKSVDLVAAVAFLLLGEGDAAALRSMLKKRTHDLEGTEWTSALRPELQSFLEKFIAEH